MNAQLELFAEHYHLEKRFLRRVLFVDWTLFQGTWLSDFNQLLKQHQLYVPIL